MFSHRIDSKSSDPRDRGLVLAGFLNELRPQSIESFKISDWRGLGPSVFHALNRHGGSLTDLRFCLSPLRTSSGLMIPSLSLLKGCTNLVSLSLTGDDCSTDRQELRNDFCEFFARLKECKKLRILDVDGSWAELCKPAWLVPMLLEKSIHLTSLDFYHSEMGHSKVLYQALANQTSL